MTYIRLFDDDGKFVVGAYFEKSMITYDIAKGVTIVPAEGIKLDVNSNNDDYDYEDDEADEESVRGKKVKTLNGAKPLYMSFRKRATKNLHYLL